MWSAVIVPNIKSKHQTYITQCLESHLFQVSAPVSEWLEGKVWAWGKLTPPPGWEGSQVTAEEDSPPLPRRYSYCPRAGSLLLLHKREGSPDAGPALGSQGPVAEGSLAAEEDSRLPVTH